MADNVGSPLVRGGNNTSGLATTQEGWLRDTALRLPAVVVRWSESGASAVFSGILGTRGTGGSNATSGCTEPQGGAETCSWRGFYAQATSGGGWVWVWNGEAEEVGPG